MLTSAVSPGLTRLISSTTRSKGRLSLWKYVFHLCSKAQSFLLPRTLIKMNSQTVTSRPLLRHYALPFSARVSPPLPVLSLFLPRRSQRVFSTVRGLLPFYEKKPFWCFSTVRHVSSPFPHPQVSPYNGSGRPACSL